MTFKKGGQFWSRNLDLIWKRNRYGNKMQINVKPNHCSTHLYCEVKSLFICKYVCKRQKEAGNFKRKNYNVKLTFRTRDGTMEWLTPGSVWSFEGVSEFKTETYDCGFLWKEMEGRLFLDPLLTKMSTVTNRGRHTDSPINSYLDHAHGFRKLPTL